MFLMLHRHLRPGYDYLLDVTLLPLWRELPPSPLKTTSNLSRGVGLAGVHLDGLQGRDRVMVSARLLIQTGQPLAGLDRRHRAFRGRFAIASAQTGRSADHYGRALFSTRSVLYHLGIVARPPARRAPTEAESLDQRLYVPGLTDEIRPTFLAYLQRFHATLSPATVNGRATASGTSAGTSRGWIPPSERRRSRPPPPHRDLPDRDPNATTRADGRRSPSRTAHPHLAMHCFLNDIGQWGWPEAPNRRLIFPRDTPRTPEPLPRYVPAEADQRLAEALTARPRHSRRTRCCSRARPDSGSVSCFDLELDCVHEVPRQGAWLKVPLGKLNTERMVRSTWSRWDP